MKTLLHVIKGIIAVIITLCNLQIANAGGEEVCEPTIVTQDRIVEVEKEVYFFTETIKKVDKTRKNRLSLLIGDGLSQDLRTSISGTTVIVERPTDTFVGAQYQRDLGRLTLGVFGTSNESVGVSIGINW